MKSIIELAREAGFNACNGFKAEQLALEYAKRLKNPLIIEIGDQT